MRQAIKKLNKRGLKPNIFKSRGTQKKKKNWFHYFKSGVSFLEIKPRCGQPSVGDYDAFKIKDRRETDHQHMKTFKQRGSLKDAASRK